MYDNNKKYYPSALNGCSEFFDCIFDLSLSKNFLCFTTLSISKSACILNEINIRQRKNVEEYYLEMRSGSSRDDKYIKTNEENILFVSSRQFSERRKLLMTSLKKLTGAN